jgi:hypothetical protein
MGKPAYESQLVAVKLYGERQRCSAHLPLYKRAPNLPAPLTLLIFLLTHFVWKKLGNDGCVLTFHFAIGLVKRGTAG